MRSVWVHHFIRRPAASLLVGFPLALALLFGAFAAPWYQTAVRAQTLPELPRVLLDTAYAPPTTGSLIRVDGGDDLQAAFNAAQPGDILELEAGATFTGNFLLPDKPGADWIYIRSSAYPSLPSSGTRVFPAQAGLMPKILTPNTQPAIRTEAQAHHYRFVGIEITGTNASTSSTVYNLIWLEADEGQNSLDQVPTDLVFDRCYIHGTPTGNFRRGIGLNSARTAIVDSYLSDFHEVGADSQAIGGWNGPGPFKIVNNYVEGAGENLMFGGADSSIPNLVPADIEIRHNHFFKPLSWKIGHPAYAGTPWSVKNLFELKNARRVLVEGNILENNWAHAQGGTAILFTVRNQEAGADSSAVQDVTFRRNILRHAGGGFNISAMDNNYPSQQTQRILIQDNLLEDISSANWGGTGRLFQFLTIRHPTSGVVYGIADLTVEHNTGFSDYANAITGDEMSAVHQGFTFRNNITPKRLYGFHGSGTGDGNTTLNTFYIDPEFVGNVLTGSSPAAFSSYPGNFFPPTDAEVGFQDLAGGDYRLADSSPFKKAGTDGKDPGADFDALEAATAGVISGTSLPMLADLNLDSRVDVVDVQLCVNVVLGTESNPGVIARADVNSDGQLNVLDVQAVVNTILAG